MSLEVVDLAEHPEAIRHLKSARSGELQKEREV